MSIELDEKTLGELIAKIIRQVIGKEEEFSIQISRERKVIRIAAKNQELA